MTTNTVYVRQVRCSNGDVLSLRMLPSDARELWLNLGVALGELPPLPADDEDIMPEDTGEAGEA